MFPVFTKIAGYTMDRLAGRRAATTMAWLAGHSPILSLAFGILAYSLLAAVLVSTPIFLTLRHNPSFHLVQAPAPFLAHSFILAGLWRC